MGEPFSVSSEDDSSLFSDSSSLSFFFFLTDFFFTTCPTICPVMKNNLLKVYNQFENNENVKYLSHTINPDYDNMQNYQSIKSLFSMIINFFFFFFLMGLA